MTIPQTKWLSASGAVLAALALALSAYAAHGAEGDNRIRLGMAAAFALIQGVALAALAPRAERAFGQFALWTLLLGTVLFTGSVVAKAFWGLPPVLAPAGGMLTMAAWLAWAVDTVRR